jgi:hypothetical protein
MGVQDEKRGGGGDTHIRRMPSRAGGRLCRWWENMKSPRLGQSGILGELHLEDEEILIRSR